MLLNITMLLIGATATALVIDLYQRGRIDLWRTWRKQGPIADGVDVERLTIRDYMPKDAAVDGMPDLEDPLFLVRKVCVDDRDRVIGAGILYLKAELYPFFQNDLARATKEKAMTRLQPELLKAGWSLGLKEIYMVVPEFEGEATPTVRNYMRQRGWKQLPDKMRLWTRFISTDGY